MAVIRKAVAAVPAKVASKPVVVAPTRGAVPAKVAKPATQADTLSGFTRLGKIEIPTKRAFGKRGVFRDLFNSMEQGEAIAITVDSDKKLTSKMNSIYNAARKAGDHGASVTMRIAEPGDKDGLGGVIHLWFNGFYDAPTK